MVSRNLALLALASLCHARPKKTPEVQIIMNLTQQEQYTPPYAPTEAVPDAPRLFIFGDVHGMLGPLEEVLAKAEYSGDRGDRVIFAGDMINKGPDSAGVIDLAIQLNATGVRGNHEDRVLRTWAGQEAARALAKSNGGDVDKAVKDYEDILKSGEMKALETARTLSREQRAWSAALPVAIRLGDLPGYGETVVVHAGMVPGLRIDDQDPWAMFNVRSLLRFDEEGHFDSKGEKEAFKEVVGARYRDLSPGQEASKKQVKRGRKEALEKYAESRFIPTDTNDGQWWAEAWNETEKAKPEGERLTLIYGHDARRGVQLHDYTIGLDSRCSAGGQLTALVLEPQEVDGVLTLGRNLVSVECEAVEE